MTIMMITFTRTAIIRNIIITITILIIYTIIITILLVLLIIISSPTILSIHFFRHNHQHQSHYHHHRQHQHHDYMFTCKPSILFLQWHGCRARIKVSKQLLLISVTISVLYLAQTTTSRLKMLARINGYCASKLVQFMSTMHVWKSVKAFHFCTSPNGGTIWTTSTMHVGCTDTIWWRYQLRPRYQQQERSSMFHNRLCHQKLIRSCLLILILIENMNSLKHTSRNAGVTPHYLNYISHMGKQPRIFFKEGYKSGPHIERNMEF
jgi:hypothetical protein